MEIMQSGEIKKLRKEYFYRRGWKEPPEDPNLRSFDPNITVPLKGDVAFDTPIV
jgi:hypothetical protein